MVDYTVGSPQGVSFQLSRRDQPNGNFFFFFLGGGGRGNTSMKIKISKMDAATLLLASSSKSERSLPV